MTQTDNTPAADTYAEVRDAVILPIARSFARRYGEDVDDMIGEAHVYFMQTFHKYDPAKGDFDRFLRFRVSRQLMESTRTRSRHKKRLRRKDRDFTEMPAAEPRRLNPELLSNDALTVLGLAVACRRAQGAANVMRRRLVHEAGWTAARFERAFEEVKQAI